MTRLALAASLLLGFVITTAPAGAQIATGSVATVYRLDDKSTFERGCFPPCLCPVLIGAPVKGTFVLTPTGFDGLFNTFAVSDVSWIVPIDGTDTVVTGSGTYRVGGEFAVEQELILDLQVGAADNVQHFDSGLVPAEAVFPDIKVTISVNGQVCFDTVFDVSASPVPLEQIRPYRLLPNSTFQRGCSGACDCAVGPLEPLVGTFALVPLGTTPVSREFAVVNVRWRVIEPSGVVSVRGAGTYEVGGEFAVQQRLTALLTVGKESPLQFDSGLVVGGGNFPRIDIRISVSGAVCFDTVMDIHAAPLRWLLRPA